MKSAEDLFEPKPLPKRECSDCVTYDEAFYLEVMAFAIKTINQWTVYNMAADITDQSATIGPLWKEYPVVLTTIANDTRRQDKCSEGGGTWHNQRVQ